MLTRFCYCISLLVILYGIILGGTHRAYAENWALFVGIDDYKLIGPDLRFCQSDAIRMKDAIIKYAGFKAENIKMLLGAQATKKGIRSVVKEWLIANVEPGDKMFFYFSGHGVQIEDPTKQEVDNKDELLCAYDSGRHSYTFIRDNELGQWMDQVNTVEKIVILDSCHSGTATRSLIGFGKPSDNVPLVKAYYPETDYAIRESTIDEIRMYDPDITEAELFESSTRGTGADTGGETSISGCRDNQVSLESPAVKGGVLTNYLIESIRSPRTDANGDSVITVHELWKETQKLIQKKGWQQDPQYHGNDKVALIGKLIDDASGEPDSDAGELGVTAVDKVTQVSGKSVQLSIGSDDGVTRGSIYTVYNASGEPKAQLRIRRVKPAISNAQVIEGSETVQVGDPVEEDQHFIESEDLLLLVEPIKAEDGGAEAIASQLTRNIKQKVQELSNVKLVDANQVPDRILAGMVTSSGELFDVSLRLININVGNSTPEHKLKIRDRDQINSAVRTFFSDHQSGQKRILGFASLIRKSYNLKALAHLENPRPAFKINATLDKGDLATVDIGDTIDISLRPNRNCYVHVLNIGSSGKITLLFPSQFEPNNFVKAGQKYTIPSTDEYAIQQMGPPGEERIKIIATTQQIPLSGLNPENMDSPVKTYNTSAPELLQRFMKDLRIMPRNKWSTETVMFTVNAPLFSMGMEFQSSLDRGDISAGLRRKFKENQIILSQNATLSVQETGHRWSMIDGSHMQMYSIRNKNNKLKAYRSLFYSTRDPLELGALE